MPLEYTNDLRAALIVPAYNEDEVIARMLAAVPPGMYEIVVVSDNGSTDSTADAAHAVGATVVMDEERGYGAACLRAIRVLPETVDAVVFMQADLSEDPREAAQLKQAILFWEEHFNRKRSEISAAASSQGLPLKKKRK